MPMGTLHLVQLDGFHWRLARANFVDQGRAVHFLSGDSHDILGSKVVSGPLVVYVDVVIVQAQHLTATDGKKGFWVCKLELVSLSSASSSEKFINIISFHSRRHPTLIMSA